MFQSINNGYKRQSFITLFPERNINRSVSKGILIWTPFFNDKILQVYKNCHVGCPSDCSFTVNKSDIRQVDAVIFQNYNLFPKYKIGSRKIARLPEFRRPEQVWILLNMEPPVNMFWDISVLNGLFNWTAWYRTDSSLQQQYGSKYVLNTSEMIAASKQFGHRNFYKEKTKEIAGMISNCKDQAQRYKLIYKMQKYLNIDMYGKCYNNTCERVMEIGNKSCDDILKQYKFYLAFENSHCKDYITEKYWNALNRNQIPIVNWKLTNKDFVIPNSYINVFDFDDIKSFVTYVNAVSSNETLYNSYFRWKLKYKNKGSCISCALCQKLHSNNFQRQVYSDLDGWVKDDICPKLTVRI